MNSGFSANCLVPTANGLMMKLVMGWPAAEYKGTANWSQVEKHRALSCKVVLQWPPFLFFVVSGSMCSTAPACSFMSGTKKATAFCSMGRTMLSSLTAPQSLSSMIAIAS